MGVAPKAFLGNYKVFGTSGVNQTLWSAVMKALDDAYNDGMDIAVLALGSKMGLYGPLDPYLLYPAMSANGNDPSLPNMKAGGSSLLFQDIEATRSITLFTYLAQRSMGKPVKPYNE